jgi:hypothetical protein
VYGHCVRSLHLFVQCHEVPETSNSQLHLLVGFQRFYSLYLVYELYSAPKWVYLQSGTKSSVNNSTYVRWGPLSLQHGASSGCGWRDSLQQWTVAVNIFNKQPQANDKGCPPSWWLGMELTTPYHKKILL